MNTFIQTGFNNTSALLVELPPRKMEENEVFFKVERNKTVGRYALATKDLKAGDLIFTEEPFAFGPKPDHPPMCLGCYVPVDGTYLCTKCKWPLCSKKCESIPAHANAECCVFANAKIKFQIVDMSQPCLQFECITVLRVLLAKEKDEERWSKDLEPMQDHNETRMHLPIWNFNQINIVNYLRGPCKLSQFPDELIHKICGILEINAFEAHTPNNGFSIHCLYPRFAVFSHNCVPNVNHSVEFNNFKVSVRATVDLSAKSELFLTYTNPIWPTLFRQRFLKASKYFLCNCARCADPTELGTHSSTLKCSDCKNGLLQSSAPLQPNANWICTNCNYISSSKAVEHVFEQIQDELNQINTIEGLETLYRKLRKLLHPRHSFLTALAIDLAQSYGKNAGYSLEELPDILLERKYELCRLALQNLDVIKPGYTRLRAIILYELHAPIILLAKNLFMHNCINKDDLRKKILEAIDILKQATDILILEPLDSPERILGQAALITMQKLIDNNIEPLTK